jgi:glutamate-1-semialdehyde 2,1-aminomutase
MSTASRDPWHWSKRAELSIAQGALTNSKRPACFIKGVFPTHLERADGAFVWDTQGKRYVDFICGLGSNLLGHAHPEIETAITAGFRKGATLSLGTPLEVELAEKLQGAFPCVERVKILKTGTEACMAAIKIARAATGRQVVVSDGYHGWSDEFVSLTPPAYGVPDSTGEHIWKFSSLEQITPKVAAVIVEPVLTDASPERIVWLQALRAKCTETGALLVFDEVITGYRFPRLSVAKWSSVEPDLIVLGKAMGGGLPIAVVGGREKIMNACEYFISSTFAGELCSISAALKVTHLVQTKYRLEELWSHGERFFKIFNGIYPDKVRITGYPTRGVFSGDKDSIDLFRQEACKAGILFSTSVFFSFPHIYLSERVLSSCHDILGRIKTGSVRLDGEPSRTPFAQQMRAKA